MKVKPVPILGPANSFFGLSTPSYCNVTSPESDTAYLVCPKGKFGPDITSVGPETREHRKRTVKLFIGEEGLYTTPCFAKEAFDLWAPGEAYILLLGSSSGTRSD